MKFKVGDKVRFVKKIELHSGKVKLGGIYKIEHIVRNTSCMPYRVENGEGFNEKELELASYTYEDLKKSPTGTKVTFENGNILTKTGKDFYEDDKFFRNSEDFKGLKDNHGDRPLGKIIKIEEPEYKTVYESKPEILDEAEKRYLRRVIRPFRSKVLQIAKKYDNFTGLEYIRIIIKDDVSLEFPSFSKNTMYKSMELDKKYTLEELGL